LQNGHLDVVQYLKEQFLLTKDDASSQHNLAFHFACMNGHFDVVKYLLEEFKITPSAHTISNTLRWLNEYGDKNMIKYVKTFFKIIEFDDVLNFVKNAVDNVN